MPTSAYWPTVPNSPPSLLLAHCPTWDAGPGPRLASWKRLEVPSDG